MKAHLPKKEFRQRTKHNQIALQHLKAIQSHNNNERTQLSAVEPHNTILVGEVPCATNTPCVRRRILRGCLENSQFLRVLAQPFLLVPCVHSLFHKVN